MKFILNITIIFMFLNVMLHSEEITSADGDWRFVVPDGFSRVDKVPKNLIAVFKDSDEKIIAIANSEIIIIWIRKRVISLQSQQST
jgi:hypothetical protein